KTGILVPAREQVRATDQADPAPVDEQRQYDEHHDQEGDEDGPGEKPGHGNLLAQSARTVIPRAGPRGRRGIAARVRAGGPGTALASHAPAGLERTRVPVAAWPCLMRSGVQGCCCAQQSRGWARGMVVPGG